MFKESYEFLYVRLRTNQGNWTVHDETGFCVDVGSAQTGGTGFLGKFTASSTWGGSAQAKGTSFRESLPQALPRKLRANSGKSRTHLHTATGAAFPAPDLRAY